MWFTESRTLVLPRTPSGAGTLSRAQPSLTRSKCRWEGSHGWGLVFGPDPPLTPVRKEVSWFEAVPFHTMRLRLAWPCRAQKQLM